MDEASSNGAIKVVLQPSGHVRWGYRIGGFDAESVYAVILGVASWAAR